METYEPELEFERLLNESVDDARFRVSNRRSFHDGDALALYGAGTLGQAVRRRLRKAGVEPIAFADDTPSKQGQTIDGLPVMTPQMVTSQFGERTVFAVTILNPALRFLEAKGRLQSTTGVRVVSFLDLAWQFPNSFLPYYQFELPQQLLAKAADIRRAFHQWEDEESRRQFVGHLKFRLFLDYDALPKNSWDNYFPQDVFPPLPADTTFVDCGAFDGDTIQKFLQEQRGHFREIFAFEPDEVNCSRLREYVLSLGNEAAQRIHIYNAGVGSRRTKLRFNPTGNTSAAFDMDGASEVEVVPIQDVVSQDGGFIYVKFDVEGAEWDALEGMKGLIKSSRPLLAVSIYHQPDDLWELPLYLKALNPAYKLFLRTQGEDGMDVICYAVPPTDS